VECSFEFQVVANKTTTTAARARQLAQEQDMVVPPPSMSWHLERLLETGVGSDVTFSVEDGEFQAHTLVVNEREPALLSKTWAEVVKSKKGKKKKDRKMMIWIEGIKAVVFKALLHFVYTDSLPEIEHDDDNDYDEEGDVDDKIAVVQHLLVAADRYGLDRLKLLSEHKLCSSIDTSNVGTVLALADQHGCNGLRKACFKFLMSGSNLKAAAETDVFQQLGDSGPSILNELLAEVAL